MKPVLSREQMRDFDRHVIEKCGVPGIVLMENAGRGAADVIERVVARDALANVVIACGLGNNGGDGFVIARHLRTRGLDPIVFLAGDPARLKGDAKIAFDAWTRTGGAARSCGANRDELERRARDAVIVDAIFGTGLDRPIEGDLAAIVTLASGTMGARIAIDVPSGIDANTGATLGVSFEADHTITFAHAKLGLLTPRGARASGALHVVDIGVPGDLGPASQPAAESIERDDVVSLIAPRAIDAHKNAAGHVGVFGGSPGKLGAPMLVARAALRSGAGLVTIATWEDAARAIESRVLEEMVTRIDRGASRASSIDAALAGKRAIAVGPGFGLDDDARDAVFAIASRFQGAAVYDADALTHFAKNISALAACKSTPVITPHPGEAARLLATTADAVESDRYAAARALAAKTRAVVVLKGACTLIADPNGRIVVSPSSNPALATAGSGDTLAGIVGAMLCALDPFDAACAAVFVHAAAADAWSATHGDRGLFASEIAEAVPAVLGALTREHAARRS